MTRHAMQNVENLYVRKIDKRIKEIESYIWSDHVTIADVDLAETPDHLTVSQARRLRYRRVRPGHSWGKPWGTGWFRLRFRIPRAFRGEPVSLLFRPEGECVIFIDGEPVQGLDPNRQDYLLVSKAKGNERFEVFVEAGVNNAFGRFARRTMNAPQIAVFNQSVWDAWHDLAALFDMARLGVEMDWIGRTPSRVPQRDTRRSQVIFGLNKAVDLFDYQDTAREAVRASARRMQRLLRPLYRNRAHDSAQTIACMGHAHIDVAWLWPLRETIRKCARTFSNVLEYMDQYPDFKFCQSQPHLYEFTRDRYPSLYRRIKAMVKRGQWIPTGCMWVEADCNVTSGESLVRQVLFGTRFFKKEFNHEVACLWLPDVFGYSAALPQVLKRSGIDYFLTTKISWNQFTDFPHHSFYWEGIDGSTVLSHFPPTGNYNSRLTAEEMLQAEGTYQEKDRAPIQAKPYGFGDGGGGPTKDMLERMRRYKDLEGMPKLKPMTPRQFFTRLERDSEDLRTYVGELYLELHRATLTTQGLVKRNNRKAELLLRDTEMIAAINLAARSRYPQAPLHEAWKTILLNQFHDVIPGSSITLVYEDSAEQFRDLFNAVTPLRDQGLQRYAQRVDSRGPGTPVLAFNSLGWKRHGLVSVPLTQRQANSKLKAVASSGQETPVQIDRKGVAHFRAEIPALGHAVYHLRSGTVHGPKVTASKTCLENECLRVRFDAQGRIRGLYDKTHRREVLAPRAVANSLILFEDKPAAWDAWDMDVFYNDKPLAVDGKLVSLRVIEQGPVRAVVRLQRALSRSVITQDIVLQAGSPRLDFNTTVDWGDEKEVLLKVAFPVNIHADKARYEIQFGSVERPTHWNTPQDLARFEVAGQKWADLSEGDYGVALLNDCKYGYDIRGNVMRLSLLRAPKSPDPVADVNQQHVFTYALLPHAGDFRQGVVRAGYDLNVPVLAAQPRASRGPLPALHSLFSISGDNIILDTIKKAEDDNSIILRLYEAHGCRGRRTLTTTLPVKRVQETNLMEKPEKRLPLRNGKLRLDFKPFEIRTLKLSL